VAVLTSPQPELIAGGQQTITADVKAFRPNIPREFVTVHPSASVAAQNLKHCVMQRHEGI
jgi:hypothetical protein